VNTEANAIVSRMNDFTYDTYRSFLEFLWKRYSIIPFEDFSSTSDPRLILRHDVDGSMIPALRLAQLENKIGIRSTFMVGFSMRFYNLFEESSLSRLKRISEMGHEIGLHYDARQYARYRLPAQEILKHELRALEMLTGKPVRVISWHNVSLGGEDPFGGSRAPLNAHDPEFSKAALYVSDSCRAWFLQDLLRLFDERPPRVQLVVHPMLWSDVKCTRDELLDNFFRDIEEENRMYREYWKSFWKSSARARSFDACVGQVLSSHHDPAD
jgi:hypothetical protein